MRFEAARAGGCWVGRVLILVVLAGCGQSGGRDAGPAGPSATSPAETVQVAVGSRPVLSSVRVAKAGSTGAQAQYTLTATVRDTDQDTVGGRLRLRVVATGQVFQGPIGTAQAVSETEASPEVVVALTGTIPSATLQGTSLRATFALSPTPKSAVRIGVSVADQRGNRSNEVLVTAPASPPTGGGSGGRLSSQQAQEVRRDVRQIVGRVLGTVGTAERTSSAETVTVPASLPVSVSVGCPSGGNAAVSGTILLNEQAFSVGGSLLLRLNACRVDRFELRGTLALAVSGSCPGSLRATVRGRITVLEGGAVLDPAFDINETVGAAC